jgi:MoaA/NifB/PqqE/SkfB family radical SAM enzyme
MSEQFWKSNNLMQMHIELTNLCNAACPMCVRFYNNSPHTRPDLEFGQITIDKFKKYFPPEVIRKCNLILFCGVHGDPCIAKDMYEICEYIYDCSKTTAVRVNTNGGMRKSDWWTKLGALFAKRKKGLADDFWEIIFSIDGLEDTNHLYRRNVEWSALMENVKAFVNAGGGASWDYLIFKHNEHQIQEAKAFSEKIGFREFIPKKALGVSYDVENKLTIMPVLNKEGELDYTIESPVNPENRNLPNATDTIPLMYWPFKVDEYRKLKDDKETIRINYNNKADTIYMDEINNENFDEQDSCSVVCKSKTPLGGKEIFVDNFGRVMPCCYIGTHLNGKYNDVASLQLFNHMNKYGWEHFSLDTHTLEEILDSGHLDRVFADSWNKDSVKNGKLAYCANTCGKKSAIDKIFSHELNDKASQMEKFRTQHEHRVD